MTAPTSISIVTPSLNQASFLMEALTSVRQQNYPALEHWVMDGGSTDDTVGILRSLESAPSWRHLRWSSGPDRGQSDALNKGFRRASGDIIGWLNTDDRYRPDCLQRVADTFAKNPDIDILYGDSAWIDECGQVFRIRREIEFSYFILLYHRVLYIPTTATFFRRRVFDDGNFLDERLQYAMDYEFFVRLARAGYRFKHLSVLLGDFRWQPSSKTMKAADRQKEEQDRVAINNSAVVGALHGKLSQRVVFQILRRMAAMRRYSEKLLRGYYFDYVSPNALLRR